MSFFEDMDELAASNNKIADALNALESCFRSVVDPKDTNTKPSRFLSAYETALSQVQKSSAEKKKGGEVDDDDNNTAETSATTNDEEDDDAMEGENEEEKKKEIKVVVANKKRASVQGGSQFLLACACTNQKTTPLSFIEGAWSIVLKLLLLPKKATEDLKNPRMYITKLNQARFDARLVLYRLLQTNQISARMQLGKLYCDDNTTLDEGDTTKSSVLWKLLCCTKLVKE